MSQTETIKPQPAVAERATYLRISLVIIFWSANWVIMKGALAFISPPSLFTVTRLAGAAITMFLVSLIIKEPLLPQPGERLGLAVNGVWQIAGMLGFAVSGLHYVAAGRAAVLVYTLPLWALLLGWVITHERVTVKGAVGCLVGFLGIALFVNPWLVDWKNPRILLGNALVMCSGLSWALGACLYRRHGKWLTSFWTQAWWQVLWSAVVIVVIFAVSKPQCHFEYNVISVGSVVFNWTIGTALCYWWWGKSLSVMPAARLGQIVTLTPVLAVLMSAVVFREHIGITVIASIILIILGIMITLHSKNVARPAELNSGD